ncbi:hypothetical protein ZWY2020_046399 [Hordeum vulgare]|nr:hypothetical protein ZWY2020_046399 [Hordeum vulgare]
MGMRRLPAATVLKLCGKDSACTTMVDHGLPHRRRWRGVDQGLLAKLAMVGGDNYDFASLAWPWGTRPSIRPSAAWGLPGNKAVGKFAGEHCIKDLNEACKDRPAPTRFTSNATKQPPDFATSRPPPSTRKP